MKGGRQQDPGQKNDQNQELVSALLQGENILNLMTNLSYKDRMHLKETEKATPQLNKVSFYLFQIIH